MKEKDLAKWWKPGNKASLVFCAPSINALLILGLHNFACAHTLTSFSYMTILSSLGICLSLRLRNKSFCTGGIFVGMSQLWLLGRFYDGLSPKHNVSNYLQNTVTSSKPRCLLTTLAWNSYNDILDRKHEWIILSRHIHGTPYCRYYAFLIGESLLCLIDEWTSTT